METMTPKEKAKELVDLFTVVGLQQRNEGIQCALIAVAEILLIKKEIWDDFHSEYFDWWNEVKKEIEKL
jgi:hypothetical protein